jgi:hypothetical protein
MYSIPKYLGLMGAAALGLSILGGCSSNSDEGMMTHGWTPGFEQRVNAIVRPSQSRLEVMLPDPAADEATVLRGWDTEKYTYPSGTVTSSPTYGANYEDRPEWLQNDYAYVFIEPGILLADIVAMPFWVTVEPVTTLVTNHGVHYPSSITVAPPLPRE